jgi:hypothetical protein
MSAGLHFDGLPDLNRELRKLADEMPDVLEQATFAGGLIVQAEAQRRTPVEFGNLQGSAYTQRIRLGAEVGFSAEYALFVHENIEQELEGLPRPSGLGTYWNPGESQFLKNALHDKIDELNSIIKQFVQRKLNR